MTGCAKTPGFARPGHETTNGTRMPPSSVVRLEPRNGSLRDPFTVVPGMVGPPLSLMKATSVLRSWLGLDDFVGHLRRGHLAAQIGRAVCGIRQHPFDCAMNPLSGFYRFRMVKPFEHQRGG